MGRLQEVDVFKVPLTRAADMDGVVRLVEAGRLDLNDLVAVIGKTEGSGAVVDRGREETEAAIIELCARHGDTSSEEVRRRICIVLSGGCPGLIAPHLTLVSRRSVEGPKSAQKRLVVGTAMSDDLLPEEIGRMPQVEAVAKAVSRAMDDAAVTDVADVHYVQVKTPALTDAGLAAARARGETTVSDVAGSMTWSSDAAALGVALALGEVTREKLRNEVIRKDFSLYSRVASTSAGGEKTRAEVVLMANSEFGCGPWRIGHDVLNDLIDAEGVRRALRSAGLEVEGTLSAAQQTRVINVFAKAKIPSHGTCRGRRFCMLEDPDIGTKPARAIVNAVVASVIGDTMNYVSGGEIDSHQAPPDAMQCAAIVRVE